MNQMQKELSLEEIKTVLTQILFNIDEFCRSKQINYSLAFGTLIGAVRHKGFIPWDDDIDIIMSRSEYERFISEYYDDRYVLLQERQLSNHLHARVADPNTRLEFTRGLRSSKFYKSGLWVDIFPIDKVPSDPILFVKLRKKLKRIYHAICVGEVKGYNAVQHIAHLFVKPFTGILIKMADRLVRRYNGIETDRVACLATWYSKSPSFPAVFLDDFVDVDFEGRKVKSIKQYDQYLRGIYGDYMQLPPIDARKPKHDYIAYQKID